MEEGKARRLTYTDNRQLTDTDTSTDTSPSNANTPDLRTGVFRIQKSDGLTSVGEIIGCRRDWGGRRQG
jgi:hypothetical protein